MSSDKVKHYLDHIEEYDKLSTEQQEECLDGCWGDLMDNMWYAMTDEEQDMVNAAIEKTTCESYGHDETAEGTLLKPCSCGSIKPYNIGPYKKTET